MRISDKQISDFAEANDMTALFGDMFELPCGNQIHESDIENMIKEGEAMWPDMKFPKPLLDNFFGDVAGSLNKLSL